MRNAFLCIVFIAVQSLSAKESKKDIQINVGKETWIDAIFELPESQEPVPALIIAPGLKYHMNAPLIEGLAKQSLKKGFAVLRFNWKNQKTDPEAIKVKHQHLQWIYRFLKDNKKIDGKRISIAGKSWGSVLAYSYFRSNGILRSLVLMNPICTWHWGDNGQRALSHSVAEKYYPDLYEESRPVHITMGKNDKLCKLATIYDYLKVTEGNVSISIFPGGQNLTIGPWSDRRAFKSNAQNIVSALDTTSTWLKLTTESQH